MTRGPKTKEPKPQAPRRASRASRPSLDSTITAAPEHMATFLHLLPLLTQAAAWLPRRSGQRLGHVCMGCNPPGLAHCQPHSSQDQAVQNWPELSGSPK